MEYHIHPQSLFTGAKRLACSTTLNWPLPPNSLHDCREGPRVRSRTWYADGKMAAIATQWKESRTTKGLPAGWALFYSNAHLTGLFPLHEQMLSHPARREGWSVGTRATSEGMTNSLNLPMACCCLTLATPKLVRRLLHRLCVAHFLCYTFPKHDFFHVADAFLFFHS